MRICSYLFLLTCTIAPAQESGYLDLVTQTIEPRQREPVTASATGGSVGVGDGAPSHPSPRPLQLIVSNVEGTVLKVGQSLTYEVTIKNVSSRPVKIPWTPSPKDIEPSKPGPYEYVIAILAPRLVNSSGQVAALEAVTIYGSEAPSTVRELSPGQWVTIRAKSRLNLPGSGGWRNFLSTVPGSVRVGAVWSLERVSVTERNGKYHEAILSAGQEYVSTNTIPMHLDVAANP